MLPLRGIVPSLNTPFTTDDRIDEASIGRLVDYCVQAGCGGLLALAVAGETRSLVLEATGGRLHVSGGWAVTQMLEALDRGVHAFMPTGMEGIYCEIFRRFSDGGIEAARELFEAALPPLVFANQHIDVSIRFFKHLRVITGLFATDRCRPPVAPLDRFQQRTAERLARYAQALEEQIA